MELISYTFMDFLLSFVLAFIMFGVGLSLTSASFKNLFMYPKPLIIGLSWQIFILPLLAFIVAYFSKMPLPFKVGLIILAACPGGTTSGVITYFFKGNIALSITFTSVNSIITLFTIPFVVNLSLLFFYGRSTIIHLSYLETIIQIFAITIIPAIIGVIVRTYKPVFAAKVQRPLKYLLVIALAAVFIILFIPDNKAGGTGVTIKEIMNILPYALLLNVLCMVSGYLIGIFSKLGVKNSYTIGIEAAVHNTTLAFLVAGTLLHNEDMVKPALIYAMFSFWTALIYSYVVKRFNRIRVFDEFDEINSTKVTKDITKET